MLCGSRTVGAGQRAERLSFARVAKRSGLQALLASRSPTFLKLVSFFLRGKRLPSSYVESTNYDRTESDRTESTKS